MSEEMLIFLGIGAVLGFAASQLVMQYFYIILSKSKFSARIIADWELGEEILFIPVRMAGFEFSEEEKERFGMQIHDAILLHGHLIWRKIIESRRVRRGVTSRTIGRSKAGLRVIKTDGSSDGQK